ncbi:unnamed protein product [Paramecium sonneborni]|uniref:non-specific serine/threonine protein kinase n=1 Tax=Paramecium sonneborni TaxID=65129 RepID=A0A8S1QNP6_9CILI|nr:unnamed protein product [Paramecium sonneborni]
MTDSLNSSGQFYNFIGTAGTADFMPGSGQEQQLSFGRNYIGYNDQQAGSCQNIFHQSQQIDLEIKNSLDQFFEMKIEDVRLENILIQEESQSQQKQKQSVHSDLNSRSQYSGDQDFRLESAEQINSKFKPEVKMLIPQNQGKSIYRDKIDSLLEKRTSNNNSVSPSITPKSSKSQQKLERKRSQNIQNENSNDMTDPTQLKLAKNRESAKNSRERKKIYQQLLEKQVQELQLENEKLKDICKNQVQSMEIVNKKTQKFQLFLEQQQQLFEKLELCIIKKASFDEIGIIMDALRFRIQSNSQERNDTVRVYFDSMAEIMLPMQSKYLIYACQNSKDMFANNKQDYSEWLKESFESTNVKFENLTKLKKFQTKVQELKQSISNCLDKIKNEIKQIQDQASKLDLVWDNLKQILNPLQLGTLIIYIEMSYRQIHCLLNQKILRLKKRMIFNLKQKRKQTMKLIKWLKGVENYKTYIIKLLYCFSEHQRMADQKIVSVFDFGKIRNKFWQPCDKSVLDSQSYLVEQEFQTAGKLMVKQVFVVLGLEYIYKVTTNKLKCAPLATMHLSFIDPGADHMVQLNSDEQQFGFKLTYQTKTLDIFLSDKLLYDQWKQHFRRVCLLENFHEAFMVSKLIGKGSFAKVYLATKKENNQQFAIKAFSKSFMQQQHKGIESLLNEMQVMRKLNHPNIVKLHEVHETTNSVYFVVDIITGGELLQRVRETGFLPAETLQKLAYNLLSALNHLHTYKIAHRDLKPENLLLRSNENNYDIILADFGLAAQLIDDNILFKRCGTPGFVAPEILDYMEGQQFYDEKCDVFSAGVILYLLITGGQPFTGKDQKAILKANKDCQIDFEDSLFKSAPIQMQDLIRSMLQKKPSYRLSSSECLRHPYFKELVKQEQIKQEKYQSNLVDYNNQFKNNVRAGSIDLSLEQRTTAFTGNMNSIESISCVSNGSFAKIEMKAPSVVGASKFSQYSSRLNRLGSRDISDIPTTQLQKTESKKHIDLHRIAIQNSHRKQIIDQFEDQPVHQENSEVSDMVRLYNSTRQIRIPDNLSQLSQTNKQTSTPTNKGK